MLEHLVEHLRGASRPRRSARDRVDDRLVDLGQPAVSGTRLGHRRARLLLEVAAEAARCRRAAGGPGSPATSSPVSREQLAAVLARLGDPGAAPAAGRRPRRSTSSTSSTSKPSSLSRRIRSAIRKRCSSSRKHLLAGHLAPERAVAAGQLAGDPTGSIAVGSRPPACRSSSSAADPLGGELDVVVALAGGERGVQLGGLGVDQVGRHRPGVEAEQRVGQRAVAPDERRPGAAGRAARPCASISWSVKCAAARAGRTAHR